MIPYVIIFYLLLFWDFKVRRDLGIFTRLKTCFILCLSGIRLLRNNLSKTISSGSSCYTWSTSIFTDTQLNRYQTNRPFTFSLFWFSLLFIHIIMSKRIPSAARVQDLFRQQISSSSPGYKFLLVLNRGQFNFPRFNISIWKMWNHQQ